MATPTRRSNDLPTAVMLATDSALCPSARVASTSRNSATAPPARRLMRPHHPAEQHGQRERRSAQTHAIEQPADRQTDDRAEQRGPQVDIRVDDAIELEVAQHRFGDEPEALRAPGSVASMITAATTTLLHPDPGASAAGAPGERGAGRLDGRRRGRCPSRWRRLGARRHVGRCRPAVVRVGCLDGTTSSLFLLRVPVAVEVVPILRVRVQALAQLIGELLRRALNGLLAREVGGHEDRLAGHTR